MSKKKSPKIGLALGGGGVRGFIHLGIYEVLKENNVPIFCVAGTSMGAIIGAAIALGYSTDAIKEFAIKYRDLNVFGLKNFNFFREGLFKRDKIDRILHIFFGDKNFSDTKIPFGCASVDLETKERVVHTKGLIAQAVAASSAYPPIFAPVFYKGRYLIDGGTLDLVPGNLARELGAEKLIAVSIRHDLVRQYISGQVFKKYYLEEGRNSKKKKAPWYKKTIKKAKETIKGKKADFRLLANIMLENVSVAADHITKMNLAQAKPEILLNPTVNIGLLDFSRLDEAIEQGREIAKEALPEILSWLNK